MCAQLEESWKEVGKLPSRYFDTTAFGASPENWSITQDNQHIIYAGNTEGLLIHDGNSWDLIPVPGGMVHALGVGLDQVVYIGGYKEIGYLGADSSGIPQYISLNEHIPEGFNDFVYAHDVALVGQDIFFLTDKYIFRWQDDKLDAWKTDGKILGIGEYGGKRILHSNRALFELDENDTILKASWQGASLPNIRGIITDGPNHFLVLTALGFFRCNEVTDIVYDCLKQQSDIDLLQDAVQPTRLQDGKIALLLVDKGILLLSPSLQFLRHIDTSSGLANIEVLDIYADRAGALWAATRDGISYVDASGNWSSFGIQEGLSGHVIKVVRWQEKIFAATFIGLFELISGDDENLAGFQQLKNSEYLSSCYDLAVVRDVLLAACLNGLVRIDVEPWVISSVTGLVTPSFYPWRIIADSFDPSLFYVAGQQEIAQYRLLENRIDSVHTQKTTARIHRIVADPRSHDLGNMRLWVVSDEGKIYTIDAPSNEAVNGTAWHEQVYLDFGQLDSRVQEFFFLENTFFSASPRGLFRLDESIPGSPHFEQHALTGNLEAEYWGQDHSGNAWLVLDDTVRVMHFASDGSLQLSSHTAPARIETLDEVEYLEERDGTVWLGQRRGVIRINAAAMKSEHTKPLVRLSKAAIHKRDSVIFKGPVTGWHSPILAYAENSMRFEYATQIYDLPEHVKYRVWLAGYDHGWSSWVSEPLKEYTNLSEGSYTFKVQAKHPSGMISEPASYHFEILPPWYRSPWGYILWGLISALVLSTATWVINRYQTRRLQARNAYLNRLVEEQTEEIRAQNASLQDAYHEVQIINDDLKKTNNALENRTDKLREALESNKEILGITAHDLKNPLGGIIGLAEMIIDDIEEGMQSTYDSAVENMPLLKTEAERLLQIIIDLLDRHREGEKPILNKEKTALDEIVLAVVRWNTKQANNKEIKIHYRAEEKAFVEADTLAIQRVLDNYVSNAIKYSPLQSNVWISVDRKHEALKSPQICVSVRDKGPGLTEQDLQKVFGKMQRLSAKPTAGEHSAGLGLFIAKQLIEAHGGQVGVDSSYGAGATFWFTLPYQR